MSLDVYLTETMRCPHCDGVLDSGTEVYSANITHNLGTMAEAAGIYTSLWRPEDDQLVTAQQIIAPLVEGLAKLKERAEFFKGFDSPNGWGKYENFVPFVERYLAACQAHPDAIIHVSR